MVPCLTADGMRVICPDLVGYGKSDKPASRDDYSYERQVNWMGQWLEKNDLSGITFFGQDWGGLIGLRLVVNHPDRFDRVVISNTGLPYNPDSPRSLVEEIENFRNNEPTPDLLEMQRALSQMGTDPARKFAYWQKFCWETEDMPIGLMMSIMMERPPRMLLGLKFALYKLGLISPLPTPLAKGYDAPFPDASYKMGPRAMPSSVPTLATSPSLDEQRKAWDFFETFEKPFVCAFADNDPVTAGSQAQFLEKVPGTRGLDHPSIRGGGHFVQENAPEKISSIISSLVKTT
jgi:haloalkane dehalogenase